MNWAAGVCGSVDGDSDVNLEDEDFPKPVKKGPTPTANPYSYLSLTDSSLQGAAFEVSPASSPDKELGGSPVSASTSWFSKKHITVLCVLIIHFLQTRTFPVGFHTGMCSEMQVLWRDDVMFLQVMRSIPPPTSMWPMMEVRVTELSWLLDVAEGKLKIWNDLSSSC